MKSDGKASAAPGTPTAYTVVVSNNGPSTAVGAAVHDVMPAELTSDAWTAVASPGSSVAASSGTGDIDTTVTLLPGGTATFTVNGNIDPSATGTLTNTAAAAAPSGVTDPDPSNNTATDTDTLAPVADLSITKTDGATDVVAGTSTTYTIVVTNGGPSVATAASVNDVMPHGRVGDLDRHRIHGLERRSFLRQRRHRHHGHAPAGRDGDVHGGCRR